MTVLLTKTEILAEFPIVLFNISTPNDAPIAKETSLAHHINQNDKHNRIKGDNIENTLMVSTIVDQMMLIQKSFTKIR